MPDNENGEILRDFITEVVGDSSFKIEEDFGGGYVRLNSSEAERRQAAQDITSSEDIVLELLRNSRDAHAKNIFLSSHREGEKRVFTVIDDGDGIPSSMHEKVFLPRVTSKLETARQDKWGFHGRGMALYSISVNSDFNEVVFSETGRGSSIKVVTNTKDLPEKTDQSTFPSFIKTDSGFSMRGAKNIFRVSAEFAFEHKEDINVFCGTPTEIASTLYAIGVKEIPASKRIFGGDSPFAKITHLLSYCADPDEFADTASFLGLDISSRSARRILDGEIEPLPSLFERIMSESFKSTEKRVIEKPDNSSKFPQVKISRDDVAILENKVSEAFGEIASRYYISFDTPRITQRNGSVNISIDIFDDDDF